MDATEARRQQLLNEHARLDKELTAELKRKVPDAVTVAELKKRKLRIKEEIFGMMEPG